MNLCIIAIAAVSTLSVQLQKLRQELVVVSANLCKTKDVLKALNNTFFCLSAAPCAVILWEFEARQVEDPMLWVLVLQDHCIFQDSLAPLLQELQVVSRCQVHRIFFALPYAVLVVLRANSINHTMRELHCCFMQSTACAATWQPEST